MNFQSPAFIKTLCNVLKLGSADNGIVAEQQTPSADLLVNGNQLHPGNQIARRLTLRHETARPGRSVFDQSAHIWFSGFIRITDCVCNAGIRNPADGIELHIIIPRHQRTVLITDRFGVGSLIIGRGITEIDPEERAYLHFLFRRLNLNQLFRRDADNFSGTKLFAGHILQIRESTAFHGDRISPGFPADDDRRAPELVAGGINDAVPQDQHGTGTVDAALRIGDPLFDGLFRIDQSGNDFRRIELPAAHLGKEMGDPGCGIPRNQFLNIIDLADSDDRKNTEMRPDNQRLILIIANHADSAFSAEMRQVIIEFGTELRIGNVVNGTHDRSVRTENSESAALGSQMGMVIGAVK